jgi:putative FmdB family regulatory protein
MPTYEYKCFACNHTFERFQSITAEPIKRCPECGKAKVKRLLGTGAGFVFKGSGFYITDYRSEGYKEKAKAESGGGSGGTSSDAKPASGGDSGGGDAGGSASAGSSESATKSPAPAAPAKAEAKPKAPDKGKGKKG